MLHYYYFLIFSKYIIVDIQMLDTQCKDNCTVTSFEDLYICRQPNCNYPSFRCKKCFPFFHRSQSDQKKPIPHEYDKFNQSPECKNFLKLIKAYELIDKKVKKTFGKLKTNLDTIAATAFYQSQIIRDIFPDNNLMNEFATFRYVYYGQSIDFFRSPSPQFLFGLVSFNDKKFEAIKNQLTEPSLEEQMLTINFNILTKTDTSELQNFIDEEQKFFIGYCQKLVEQKQNFFVQLYLQVSAEREKKNANYYRRQFENFLEEKYEKNPSEKGVFTLAEYSRYFWHNFTFYCKDQSIHQYFNHVVDSYAIYSKYCSDEGLEESLLGFRMWKSHAAKFNEENIGNLYFFHTFMLAYIQFIIDHKNTGSGELRAKNWLQYAEYLQDFVKASELNKEEFISFQSYKRYFNFRKDSEKFISFIENSTEIVFNRSYAVEYLNKVYNKDTKISNKHYKLFIEGKEEEEKEKQMKLVKTVDELKDQLQKEEGNKFYPTVFDGFVANAVQSEVPLTKENYYSFKAGVLEEVNEDYIRRQNEEIMMKMKKEEKQETKEIPKESGKIKFEISKTEEAMHQVIDHEEEEEEVEMQVCPCCNGEPEDCQQTECQMMGYCVTCSL